MYFFELEVIISRGLGTVVQCCMCHSTPVTISSLYSYSSATKGVIVTPLETFAVIQLAKREQVNSLRSSTLQQPSVKNRNSSKT